MDYIVFDYVTLIIPASHTFPIGMLPILFRLQSYNTIGFLSDSGQIPLYTLAVKPFPSTIIGILSEWGRECNDLENWYEAANHLFNIENENRVVTSTQSEWDMDVDVIAVNAMSRDERE